MPPVRDSTRGTERKGGRGVGTDAQARGWRGRCSHHRGYCMIDWNPDTEDKRTYYHTLLTSSSRPLNTLLYNEAREFFQDKVFGSAQHNAEYKLHLGLSDTESVFDA